MNPVLGRRSRILAATTATAGLLLVAGCSSDDGGSTTVKGVKLVKGGQLTTCTHLPYPPFQSEIDGKVQGFDVSLIDLVAKDLGVKQEFIDTPFENFKTGAFLNSGECDLAAAGMTITEERKKNVDFSDPYFEATQAVLVDKKSGITSFADLKGKKVGTQAQTTGEDYAKGQGIDPVSFESSDAVLNGLRTGQVQAVVIDYPVVQGWLKDKANADAFEVADNINTGEEYGFTVKKGNTELLAAVNKAITAAKADGTYKTLYEKWIGPYDESAASASPSAPASSSPSGSGASTPSDSATPTDAASASVSASAS
ncbi:MULTISPECIES: basic amino acid ABC transporter substrate-binding protein [unclassified Streptomyces]|uniref:basic amino acid ABC transporter substrate-binding protein n=1 Tax=unclassified Streptomyces TaxID=2593676 RepID=UPI003650344E